MRRQWIVWITGIAVACRLAHSSACCFADDHPLDRVLRGAPQPEYPHRAVRMRSVGTGSRSYWLFEPAEPKPLARAPVIVFLHGWMGVNPAFYGAWIEHLARNGGVVIFPRYQADFGTSPSEFLPNTIAAALDALDVLETSAGSVRPDPSRFALIGHSAGGNLAAQVAALAKSAGLPIPKAVVSVMPGEVVHLDQPRLENIASDTLLVVVVGDRDIVVGDHRAREIFEQASSIPPDRKEFVLYRTDRRGPISLIADHLAPTGALSRFDSGDGVFRSLQIQSAQVDLLDRFGFWRMADVTLQAAFSGKTLDEVTDHGALFRDLGRWSNGLVVRPPISGDDLSLIPRVALPHGARLMPAPSDWLQLMQSSAHGKDQSADRVRIPPTDDSPTRGRDGAEVGAPNIPLR